MQCKIYPNGYFIVERYTQMSGPIYLQRPTAKTICQLLQQNANILHEQAQQKGTFLTLNNKNLSNVDSYICFPLHAVQNKMYFFYACLKVFYTYTSIRDWGKYYLQ